MRVRTLQMAAVGATAIALLAGCGSDSGDGAGSVTAYCSMSEDDCQTLVDDFTAETGIDVAYVRMSVGENLARIKAEADNPQAALWIGGSAETYVQAAEEGLLAPYAAEGIDQVDEIYRDPDDLWTPTSTAPVAFASNQALLDDLGVEAPTSWEDLADPAFANSVVLAHPASSGTGAAVVSTLVQLYGEDEAFDLMKRIDANVAQYTRSGGAPTRMVGLGEAAVSATYLMDVELGMVEGYDITASFPEEGTGFGINAAAVIADAPEDQIEGAEAFLDWVLTEGGQESMMTTFWQPVIPGITNPEAEVDTSEVTLMDYDTFWAGQHRGELIERFDAEIRHGSEAE
ncbi:ABC transporter substrate-binding protein [Aeromicrobium piscarium]|uniref:ABC transporter substrate-binding protein n=1 Tax=Aeromicrobium piscarium TaxID=2590901 RepID=A0A554RXB3_9ACTN|nr:ABC transporter substrate-binding protein [Aeromicrobium piscarium]TSD58736.1 ABC transporter substrate-binding protein [Aeromicrobium piscarium]